jgi:hypothetical protein
MTTAPKASLRVALHIGGLIMVSSFGLGCRDDSSIKVYREPPSVQIIEPSDGSRFNVGESVLFTALAETFDETDVTELHAQWVTGTSVVCEWEPVPSDGQATCGIEFDTDGEHTVTVTVKDTRLDTATDTVSVNLEVNHPPIIKLLEPEDGSFFAPGENVVFQAEVNDAEDTPSDLVVRGSTTDGLDLGFSASPASSGSWSDSVSDLPNGAHVIKLTVTDTIGAVGEIEELITITINGRPSAPTVSIVPSPAPSGNQLTVSIDSESTDPEGDAITYQYDWYLDGTAYASGSASVIPPGVTMRDETWRVEVTPTDGYGDGDVAIAEVTIINSPPSVDNAILTPSSPTTVDEVLAVGSGWDDQDEDPETYQYLWEKNGTADLTVSTDTYPASSTVKGDILAVRLTPVDDMSAGANVWSTPVEVLNSPPGGQLLEITPAAPEPEEDLICAVITAASDADDDFITYTYAWAVDGVTMSGPDFDGAMLAAEHTDNGETWECTVTASDDEEIGSSETTSVYVSDGTVPDPPIIDDTAAHRNSDTMDLVGDCEPECTLTFYCEDSASAWVHTDACTTGGSFGTTIDLTVGETTTCYATCTDAAGNVSGPSNDATSEVCDPQDVYEEGGYGDDPIADPIDEWSTVPDDGSTTITFSGNVLDEDDEDWYIISAEDDLSEDLAAGIDYFRFGVEMISGDGTYSLRVYKGDPYPDTDEECTIDADGYTEYEWYNQDLGDSTTPEHIIGTPLNTCGPTTGFLNHCADDTDNFYIQVYRNAEHEPSCASYEIEITNGEGW